MNPIEENTKIPKLQVNYLFFGIYFFVVAFVHVFHVFLIEPQSSVSSYFFFIYALAQCLLETLLLVLFAGLIHRYFPKGLNFYAIIVFFLFLSHLIDFPLVRLMDISFWYGLHFISQESYENFIELLLASNVSIFVWVLAGLTATAVLFSGIFLFKISNRWSQCRPLMVSLPVTGALFCSVLLFLFSWDYGVGKYVARVFFDRYQKTLPWKNTFFPQKIEYLSMKTGLKKPETEEELLQKLDSRIFSLERKPDIYLFIVESLREDFINEVNTPNLKKFKEDNLSFPMALSNANATMLSWFSIFYSKFPFYWGKYHPNEFKAGSFSLRLLKKMGYKIHVSSSARLSFYQMDRLIFGEGQCLADSFFIPDETKNEEPYLRDLKAMQHLSAQMQTQESGRIFIIFLDATHLDYSWPKEKTYFVPIDEKINYFKAAMSRGGVEKIKNRYRNSLKFVDSLFEQFFQTLKNAPGGDEAVVVITGDHGEEFYEHGNLFHASSLSHPQMHIPLYYRFGNSGDYSSKATCNMTCHMYIFPTLFHYLLGEAITLDVLQGESIFKTDRWPYTVIARFNASRSPTEFCIHNGDLKLIAEFNNQKDIFNAKRLRILSTKNCKDENIVQERGAVQKEFDAAFDRIFCQAR